MGRLQTVSFSARGYSSENNTRERGEFACRAETCCASEDFRVTASFHARSCVRLAATVHEQEGQVSACGLCLGLPGNYVSLSVLKDANRKTKCEWCR